MPGRLLPEAPRRLDCCTPQRVPFPSGIAWAHSRYCSRRRGQKLSAVELAEFRGRPLVEGVALTPADADRLEPVGETALRCWLAHPYGCRCFACRYTEEHLDDGDDDEGGSL